MPDAPAHPFPRSERWRRRAYEVLEERAASGRIGPIVNGGLVVLIVANVVAVALETVDWIAAAHARAFHAFEIFSVMVFTAEFFARWWIADLQVPLRHRGRWSARLRYLVHPSAIIDLLAVLPFYIGLFVPAGDLRFLRVFRLVRFLKLARYSPGLGSLWNAIRSESRALIATFVVMMGLVHVAATALYLIEREVQPDAFGSIPDAMWWALATLTTVGYGDVVPITPFGKVIGGAVMIFGLAAFAVPIGIIATAFSQEIHRRDFVVTWGMVAKVPLFERLSAREISDVMTLLQARTVEAGSIITRRGDPAHSMYFIATGAVDVSAPGLQLSLTDGSFFGEIAVLQKARRTATVRAVTRTKLLVLDAADLHSLMERQPDIAAQISTVAEERLARITSVAEGDIVTEEITSGEH